MRNDLEGKVALVCGSTRGIGRTIADLALFLAGGGSDRITGRTISVNGGLSFPG